MPMNEIQYMRQQEDANATRAYAVNWDNGNHACGTFDNGGEGFATKREALAFAREWKRSMVAVELTPKNRAEARRDYQWEIIEGWCVAGDFVAEDN